MKAEVTQPVRSASARPIFHTRGSRPVRRCGTASQSHPQEHGSAGPAGAPRVLVIDDESSIRMLCRVNLAASGIEVLEAEDGETGFELGRRELPDLILLDVMMPGTDGWEIARRFAADPKTREIPVVFLTARAGDEDRRLGEQTGGVGYIVKPFDPVEIGNVVQDVLTRIERGEREDLRRAIVHPPEEYR